MLQKVYSTIVRSLLLIVFIVASQLLPNNASAQVIWSSAAGNAWLLGTNWTGSAVPTSTQIAEFDANPTGGATVGIAMNGATNNGTANQAVGAIYSSTVRANALTISNSTVTTGTLTLNGATIGGVSNVILDGSAGGQKTLTITNGSGIMNVAIGTSNPVVIAGAGTNSGLGNTINVVSAISGVSGSTPITVLGNGTFDGTLNLAGVNGGTLELGGANTFSGGVIIGTTTSGSPTYNNSGTLQLDVTNAIPNIAGNNIVVNNNSELLINSTATGAFTTNNITLTLNGLGNNSNSGALRVKTASGSWNGPINLASTAMITITSATTNIFNISGNISGAGQLQKQGGGALELSGTANSWTGGTLLGNGVLTIDAGSSLSIAGLSVYQTSTNNVALNLNNAAQTLDSLSSNFTAISGTQTQVITLGAGHILTLNQAVNTSYGVGLVPTLTSTIVGAGSIIKTGPGSLTLTGGSNTFSGGLTITGGSVIFTPTTSTYATTTSATGASPLTLNGGTLSTNGIGANPSNPIYFGTLTLTNNAAINLDATNQHSIKFANSSGITWTSAKTLTITNWTGGGAGTMSGTKGQVFVGTDATGLTLPQLAQIQFNIGGINYPATILSTGEIVPKISITTTAAGYGPFCNGSSNTISVGYAEVGTLTGTYYVQLSNVGGAFLSNTTSNIIGTGTGSSPISATIPAGTTAGNYRVRVINTIPIVFGTDNASDIVVNSIPSAITGTGNVCVNASLTLSDVSTGTWSTANTALATVDASSGIVTGVGAGTPAITFTLPVTGCSVTATVTVLPIPAPISGGPGCVGTTTAFTDATAFGAWSSSNLSAATIGSSTGEVTGVALGSSDISYTLSTGCFVTYSVSINSLPASISGIPLMCAGAGVQLSDATTAGSWSSSNFALATVNSTSGFVTGVAAGNPVITYTSPVGCTAMITATVNPLPAPISGQTSVYCIGSSASLSDASGGGTWTSGNTAIATISNLGVVTGVAAGTSVITYELPTGCLITLAENISSTPAAINGPSTSCVGTNTSYTDATAFGIWSSSNASIAAIGSGTGIVTGEAFGTAVITYALSSFCLTTATVNVSNPPSTIIGNTQVCVNSSTTLSDVGGGTWSSNIPPLADVGSSSGIVSGIVAGSVIISYTLPNGCYTTTSVTVNPVPSIIGSATICQGAPTTLTGSISGGTWSTSNSAAATIGLNSGLLTAGGLGSTFITYTLPLPTGCSSTENVTVSLPPSAITGASSICAGGLTTTYTDAGGGGWYSSNPAAATIGFGTGMLTSVAQGTTIITYSLGTSCIATTTVTVNPLPAGITGVTSICPGLSTTLSDITPGGAWSSSNTTLAIVGSGTGAVTGISSGSPVITYMLPTGCIAETSVVVNPVPSITGITQVCAGSTTSLSNTITGGTWTSSNNAFATAGLSTGIVTGVAVGTPVISYTLVSGCIATTSLTVDPALTVIVGNPGVCLGASITLSDATTGGTWSSNNLSVATIDPATGAVTSLSAGVTNIIYATSAWCTATKTVTVNPLPVAITGGNSVCLHLAVTLSDANTGGIWSAGSTTVTVVAGSGLATGVATGTSVITYTLPTTCINTTTLTVNALPLAITGTARICQNTTSVLSDATIGGLWTSSNSSVAGIGSATGILTGVNGGTANTTYTSSLGCIATMSVAVDAAPNVYTVTGGGSYCAGDTGVHIGLNNSELGIRYQLYKNAIATGIPKNGVSTAIDFGLFTAAGTYTAVATNTTSGCISTMNDSAVIIVNPSVSPQVMLSTGVGAGDTVCLGSLITFTAQTLNGGSIPTYSWKVNGLPVGTSDSTYAYVPGNGNLITVRVTSNSVCAVPDTATDSMRVVTQAAAAPSVFISASPATGVAIGQADTLTAIPTNCGSSPHYQWFKNGILIAGATNNVYTSGSFVNGDSISCRVITSGACGGQLTYNSVIITVFSAGVNSVATGNNLIQLIPNPNKGMFTVKGSLSTMQDENVTIAVTDMIGHIVYSRSILAHDGNINERIALDNSLANGMYILEVKSGSENKMFHFVVGK